MYSEWDDITSAVGNNNMHDGWFVNPNGEVAYRSSNSLKEETPSQDAVYLQKAHELNPTNPHFIAEAAAAYFRAEKFEQAETFLNKCVVVKADDSFLIDRADCHNSLGVIYQDGKLGKKDCSKASVHFEKAHKLNPTIPVYLVRACFQT